MEMEDALRSGFPKVCDGLLKMADVRKDSDASVMDMGVDDPIGVLEKVGRNGKALTDMAKALAGDSPLVLEYYGPFGEVPGYRMWKNYLRYDYRRTLGVFVITDCKGIPAGIVPMDSDPENVFENPYESLREMRCTAVTDRTYYSRELVRNLEKGVDDYLLVQVPFPVSYSSTRNAQMLDLRHNGRDLKACKVRYDKRWLFRFTDPVEAERIRSRIQYMDVHRNDVDVFELSAGSTDVISNVGHDIREVRELLDLRERMDVEMRRHRRLLGNDTDILSDDAVIGYMLMSVISTRLSFTDAP